MRGTSDQAITSFDRREGPPGGVLLPGESLEARDSWLKVAPTFFEDTAPWPRLSCLEA